MLYLLFAVEIDGLEDELEVTYDSYRVSPCTLGELQEEVSDWLGGESLDENPASLLIVSVSDVDESSFILHTLQEGLDIDENMLRLTKNELTRHLGSVIIRLCERGQIGCAKDLNRWYRSWITDFSGDISRKIVNEAALVPHE